MQGYLSKVKLNKGTSTKDVRTKSRIIDPPLSARCLHWLNPLSVRTHHKFRKIRS